MLAQLLQVFYYDKLLSNVFQSHLNLKMADLYQLIAGVMSLLLECDI